MRAQLSDFADERPARHDMPILIVDDLELTRDLIRAFVVRMGYTDIDVATDGNHARAMLAERVYGLIISDWHMPPSNGYELLKFVRSTPALARTPFIMVTAKTEFDNAIAAREAGVDYYLLKPFSISTLRDKIEIATRNR
jgi:two-component system chemotaxis response regulator CheY